MSSRESARRRLAWIALFSTAVIVPAGSACTGPPVADVAAVGGIPSALPREVNDADTASVSAEGYEQLLRLGVFEHANVIASPNTEAMAAESDVVVEGTIQSWLPGESVHYDNGDVVLSTIVLELEGIRVLSGTLPPNTDRVYVNFVSSPEGTSVATALPKGMRAIAYLDKAERTEPPARNLRGRGNGAPPGAQLWTFSVAEGFVVDLGAGEVKPGRGAEHRAFWPLLNHLEGAPLSNAEPGGPSTGHGKDARS